MSAPPRPGRLAVTEPPPGQGRAPGGPGLRIMAVFHLADASGPAYSLRPRLEALTAAGGSLAIVAPGEGSLPRVFGGRVPVRTLAYEPLTVPRTPARAVRGLARFVGEVRRFRQELRRARPELVVVVTAVLPAALLAARLEGLPTVVYVGEIFDKGHVGGGLRAVGGRAIARLSEALADRLVCCSRTVAAQFRRGRAVTIYPGISRAYAGGDRASFRARHELEDDEVVIAMIGNLSPGRGQDVAIRALPPILEHEPRARLVIAGHPHPRPVDHAFADELRELASALGVAESVTFAGAVERVADVYAAADFVVNPARFNEPFGRVGPEALMAGRPVVASAVGAIPEVLRDGRDALLVPPGEPPALAAAVLRLVADPALRARLVAEGGRRVETAFSEDLGVAAFTDVVGEIMDGRAERPGAMGR
jgi:glycosyltransferase involved in cell wall biosynthesis